MSRCLPESGAGLVTVRALSTDPRLALGQVKSRHRIPVIRLTGHGRPGLGAAGLNAGGRPGVASVTAGTPAAGRQVDPHHRNLVMPGHLHRSDPEHALNDSRRWAV